MTALLLHFFTEEQETGRKIQEIVALITMVTTIS
jgi:hypothetical protein